MTGIDRALREVMYFIVGTANMQTYFESAKEKVKKMCAHLFSDIVYLLKDIRTSFQRYCISFERCAPIFWGGGGEIKSPAPDRDRTLYKLRPETMGRLVSKKRIYKP